MDDDPQISAAVAAIHTLLEYMKVNSGECLSCWLIPVDLTFS